MPISRTEQMLDKMRYDIHDIDKQLKRIADALDRAYPKRKLEDGDDFENISNCPCHEDYIYKRHPPIETVETMW